MLKRLWFTGSVSLIGIAALAAVIAVSASAGTARRLHPSTLPLAVVGSDVDFSDPALAYGVLSWEIEYATCSKLMNYPDVGRRGFGVYSRRTPPPCRPSRRRQDLHVHVKRGLKFKTARRSRQQVSRPPSTVMLTRR